MKKIVLESMSEALPKVVHHGGRIWENAKGGPYKYGQPIYANHIAFARIREL